MEQLFIGSPWLFFCKPFLHVRTNSEKPSSTYTVTIFLFSSEIKLLVLLLMYFIELWVSFSAKSLLLVCFQSIPNLNYFSAGMFLYCILN